MIIRFNSLILIMVILAFSFHFVHAEDQPKTVLAIYMVGSDLEYDSKFTPEENTLRKETATNDIKEMVQGWESGFTDFYVVVAYGGSEKKGWDGMTVATIQDLQKDLENGIVGDTEEYYQGWEDEDMGSTGLEVFLKFLEFNYPDSRMILILWNHGNSYMGFGKDMNHGGSTMDLPTLRTSLSILKKPLDIIGFDACFMADLEVARAISPYSHYLIASEDSEPDHGWDYTALVSDLGNDPSISLPVLGKKIIDAYTHNPSHQKGSLSLSLLNLDETESVQKALGNLADGMYTYSNSQNPYNSLSRLIGKLNGIGGVKDKEGNNVEYMVDLKTFAHTTKKEIPSLTNQAINLEDSLSDFIVYSNHDTPISQIQGVGIFSPIMAVHPGFNGKIQKNSIFDVSPEWIDFLNIFASLVKKDTKGPEIKAEKGGFSVKDEGYFLCTAVYYQLLSNKSRIVLAQEPLNVDESGYIIKPSWEGFGTVLTDGTISTILPVYYSDTTDSGIQLYKAWGKLIQGNQERFVSIDLWYDSELQSVKWTLKPYTISDEGLSEIDRSAANPYPGDLLAIYSLVVSSDGTIKKKEIGRVTWNEKMKITHQKMPCGLYEIQVMAIDLAGNIGESENIPYSISCIVD